MIITETKRIWLQPYSHEDDRDMYECWQDREVEKAYNGIMRSTFEEFCNFDIERFRFWVTIVDKESKAKVGTMRLGLDEMCPDLAIWLYKPYRGKGFGTEAFRLALRYLFETYGYEELSAGCYEDNEASQNMLSKVGFWRRPDRDEKEESCFTGELITQQEYRINYERLIEKAGEV